MQTDKFTHATLAQWLAEGRRVVRATLVEVLGSSPFDVGATMLVDEAGHIEGSVTGGCVEAALAQEAQQILRGGPPRLLTYGISDELAGDAGLMCGGTVRIFLSELAGEAAATAVCVAQAVADGRPAALATLLDGEQAGGQLGVVDDGVIGTFGATDLLDRSVARDSSGLLDQGT
jgi:xanthine dehydrogenase accessory factor